MLTEILKMFIQRQNKKTEIAIGGLSKRQAGIQRIIKNLNQKQNQLIQSNQKPIQTLKKLTKNN
jgi:hypothetical protein